MMVLGLTGGIASGKSTVVQWFRELGVPVLDADEIVRDLQQPRSPMLRAIAAAFGEEFLHEDGSLNRGALGQLIFTDPEAKKKLDELAHPLVKNCLQEGIEEVKASGKELVVLDVPLLYETGFQELVDKVLVVYVPREIQVQRLMERDGIDREYALSKIASQGDLEEKRAQADFILDNSQNRENLRQQFDYFCESFIRI